MVTFFLGTIVPLTVLFPIVIGTVVFKKLPFYLKVIVVFSYVSGLSNGASFFLAKKLRNNMPAFHFFTIAGFILCSLFYKKALEATIVEKLVIPIVLVFLAFAATSTILWQGFFEFNSYTLSFQTLVTIAYCIMLFYKLLGADRPDSKGSASLIWVNAAFLLYFCGSLFLFLFPQFMTAPKWVYDIGWIIHAVLVLLMYTFFSIAFIKYRKA